MAAKLQATAIDTREQMDMQQPKPEGRDIFLEEYSSAEAVQKYSKGTAGWGISYLLEHDYRDIYVQTIDRYVDDAAKRSGIRVLEFGCGAGMNLIQIVSMLDRKGWVLREGIGTDFSETLISAATEAAQQELPPQGAKLVRFVQARNEALISDLSEGLKVSESSLLGSFDLILGVNTSRYCHRMGKALEYAESILRMLKPCGVCVIIDMNQGFPLFRSRLSDMRTMKPEDYYLPTLDEYAQPFKDSGFEILRQETFCWIPHSAGPMLTRCCAMLTPVLSAIFPRNAMRCLVVARKPA